MTSITLNTQQVSIKPSLYSGSELLELSGLTDTNLYLDIPNEVDFQLMRNEFTFVFGNETFVTGCSELPSNPCLNTPITIKLNGKTHKLSKPKISGVELKQLDPSIPCNEAIFIDVDGLPDQRLKDDQVILIHSELCFITAPCGNVGDINNNLILKSHFQELKNNFPTASLENDNGRYCLIIRDYPIPDHWDKSTIDLLVDIHPQYPSVPLDMFYVRPNLRLKDQRQPANAEVSVNFLGQSWQRFSWHYQSRPWTHDKDNLLSHIRFCQLRFDMIQ